MRALIFAAGRGERMRPLTDQLPKVLLEVHGRSLIEHHLLKLKAAGFEHVVINLSYLGFKIESALGDGSRFGLHIHYSHEGDTALETGGGIKHALPLLGAQPFAVISGDVYSDFDYQGFKCRHEVALAHLVMVPNPEHHAEGDFALSDGRLHTCGFEKLTYSGLGVIHPRLLAGASERIFKLGPVLREAMAFGTVSGELHAGFWSDVGTIERLYALRHR